MNQVEEQLLVQSELQNSKPTFIEDIIFEEANEATPESVYISENY